MRRQNIHPYLSPELMKRFKGYCDKRQVSQSSVVEAALQEYLGQNGDTRLILRRLDRLGRKLDLIEREACVMAEAFGVFVKLWFAHTPMIDESAMDDPGEHAVWGRYREFMEYVGGLLAQGHRFSSDLEGDADGLEDVFAVPE